MSSATAVAELVRALEDAGVVVGANPAAYAVAGREPLAVAYPATIDELSAALHVATRQDAAVVPWGGGTRMGLGAPPSRYRFALDLRGMGSVVAHEPADLTVTVEAGCTIAALQAALARAGQWLPMDPPLPDRATVGGTLAAGLAGPLGAGFGLPRELVIGMRAVLADGTMVKSGGNVVKNVTGYAMDRLHVGGLGTLGVIAEATFKILPLPQAEATVIAGFTTPEAAAAACAEVSALGLPILAAEALAPGATRGAVGIDGGEWALTVRVAGRKSAVTRSVDAWGPACRRQGSAGVETVEGEESRAVWERVADLGFGHGPPSLAVRIAVPPLRGPEAADAARRCAPHALVALSVPRGVVRLADPDGGAATDASVASFLESEGEGLRAQVAAMGGSLTIECRRPIPDVDAWGPPGDGFRVMGGLKEQYDPQGILNPGRFLGGL